MGAIRLEAVEKWFGNLQVIKGIDLEFSDGEFVVLVGPSGCGKTTLLRMIAGLEETSRGKILIDGSDVTDRVPSERELSMVFQSYALYPHMSVGENMGFGLKTAGVPKGEIDGKVGKAAAVLKLDALLERRPKALSGGQRQRVAIGRAIVREPKAFLFDEPLSNLDAALRVEMRLEIARLHQQLGTTMVYVTHDQVEAMTLADKIVLLEGGVVKQVGTPRELYESPQNEFVAGFIGSPKMNFVLCSVEGSRFEIPGQPGGEHSLAQPPAGIARLGIRPEHIALTDGDDAHCRGVAEVVEYLGAESYVFVKSDGLPEMTVRVADFDMSREGSDIGLRFDCARIHFFNESGDVVGQ